MHLKGVSDINLIDFEVKEYSFKVSKVSKLIFSIKHCVLSATAKSFPQRFCRLELSERKKGFKSFLTVCESCVRFVLILFTSFRDSQKIPERNGVWRC